MKTPREILFARHQTAAPKLDAIRREVVAGLNPQDTKARSGATTLAAWGLGGANKLWLELVWPCRRVWTGLAAAWILILMVNFSLRDNAGRATGKPARSGEMIMSVQAQQRWMNELLADSSAPPEADRPRNVAPKPRSEKTGTAAV